MDESLIKRNQEYTAVYNRGDMESVTRMFADDMRILKPDDVTIIGQKDCVGAVSRFRKLYPSHWCIHVHEAMKLGPTFGVTIDGGNGIDDKGSVIWMVKKMIFWKLIKDDWVMTHLCFNIWDLTKTSAD